MNTDDRNPRLSVFEVAQTSKELEVLVSLLKLRESFIVLRIRSDFIIIIRVLHTVAQF
jgi:hypothetical protein